MTGRFVIGLVFVALTLLPSGASFANVIPIDLQTSTGSFSFGSNSVTFAGISGPALFKSSLGTYSLADNTLTMTSGSGGKQFFNQPDPTLFTVDVLSERLTGWLSLDFMQTIDSLHTFFEGAYAVTSSTTGFASAGFSVGTVADLSFVTDDSTGVILLSDGEIDPRTPEPGTLALLGSGLLVAAGLMGRRS